MKIPLAIAIANNPMAERLRNMQHEMRCMAAYMQQQPDPWKQRSQELFGASGVIGQWIEEAEDDGK